MAFMFSTGARETGIYLLPLWLSHKKQGPQVEMTDLGYYCLWTCLYFKSSMKAAIAHFIEVHWTWSAMGKGFFFGELLSLLIHFVEQASLWFSPLLPTFSLTGIGRILKVREDSPLAQKTGLSKGVTNVTSNCCSTFLSLILLTCKMRRAIVTLTFILSLAYQRF